MIITMLHTTDIKRFCNFFSKIDLDPIKSVGLLNFILNCYKLYYKKFELN